VVADTKCAALPFEGGLAIVLWAGGSDNGLQGVTKFAFAVLTQGAGVGCFGKGWGWGAVGWEGTTSIFLTSPLVG